MHEDVLYQFALDCIGHRKRRDCNFVCKTCPSNVALYEPSKQQAVMLLHSAELEVQRQERYDQAYANYIRKYNAEAQVNARACRRGVIALVVIGVLYLLFIGWLFFKPKKHPAPKEFTPAHVGLIFDTLDRIYEADFNGDGLINCIDMAIQFYNAYPNREEIRIIVQHNYKTDFHHLFVSIQGEVIEPAATLSPKYNGNSQLLGITDYWGSRYDPRYDTDVTAHWPLIRVNKYRW